MVVQKGNEAGDLIKNLTYLVTLNIGEISYHYHIMKTLNEICTGHVDVVLYSQRNRIEKGKEVVDVWFDSGAMPFAQDHYPFENKEYVDDAGFPAEYIS
jgi:isoleucyl-tRNA synthetase